MAEPGRSAHGELHLLALPGFPLIGRGADLAQVTAQVLSQSGLQLRCDDVLVFAQKIVSKAEGRMVDLASVTPGPRAIEIAAVVQKDPRLVELVLRESRRIVRWKKDVLIVEHRLGFILANAGIDQSNVAAESAGAQALLLPEDPDRSARSLRERLATLTGQAAGVIICDSFGRPWRLGTVGTAIGCAGLPALLDLRGRHDLFGRALRVTTVAHADEIASAASILMGQSGEGQPVVLVRGLTGSSSAQTAASLLRPPEEDLFR
jgi:coenzyme F420-0:L-glutamate ligase / coenzyme F420-1:gamma-L-glutamate ligase